MNIDKYTRSRFYSTNTVNGIQEPDFLTNKFKDFAFKRPRQYYTVKHEDIQRPELISFKVYGSVNYWWIIMKVNNIEDVWHDLHVGVILEIPNINDVEEYVIKSRRANGR